MFSVETTVKNGENVETKSARTAVSADVTKQVLNALKAGRKYGRYMILRCSDGVRVLETKVTDMNTDPRSLPFVTRSAFVDDGSFELLSAALSADGETPDIELLPGGVTRKYAGVPLTLSVKIAIAWTRDCATFTGGDNPLVKYLLGEGELGRVQMRLGRNRSELGIAPPASDDTYLVREASMRFDTDGITFTSSGSGTPVEVCLLVDGTACVRALPLAAAARVLTASGRCLSEGCLAVSREVTGIGNVTCAGIPVTDFRLEWGREKSGSPIKLAVRTGENPVFTSDGDFLLAAAVADGEATLFKSADGEPVCLGSRKVYGQASKVRLTRDGTLLSYDGENAVIAFSTGEEARFKLEPFDDWAVSCVYAGRYTVLVLRDTQAVTYDVTAENFTESDFFELGAGACIGTVDSRRLVMAGEDLGSVIGGDGTDIEDCIYMVLDDFMGTDMKFTGHMLSFYGEGDNYIVDSTISDGYPIDPDLPFTVENEVCAQDGTLYLINTLGAVCDVADYPSDVPVSSYCRLGEFVLRAHTDGSLDYLPLGGYGVMIRSDMLSVGSTVTYTYRSPTVTDAGRGIKTEIGIKF